MIHNCENCRHAGLMDYSYEPYGKRHWCYCDKDKREDRIEHPYYPVNTCDNFEPKKEG